MSFFGLAGAFPILASGDLDPLAAESLLLYLDARDVTTGDADWQSRASAGSSGGVVMLPHSAGDPLSLAPIAAPSGNPLRVFNPSGGYTGGLLNNTDAPLLGLSGEATIVLVGKYQSGTTSGFGHSFDSALLSAYNQQFYVCVAANNYQWVGGAGADIGPSILPLTPDGYFILTAQYSDTLGARVRHNAGPWSSWTGSPWTGSAASAIYMGFDPTFGAPVSFALGKAWISNAVEGDTKVSEWESIGAEYLGIVL